MEYPRHMLDEMDVLWYKLNSEQQDIVGKYSEMLYLLKGDCPHRHMLGRVQSQLLLGNNNWTETLTKMSDDIRKVLNQKCVSVKEYEDLLRESLNLELLWSDLEWRLRVSDALNKS